MVAIAYLLLATVCVGAPWLVARRTSLIKYISPLHLVAIFAFLGVFLKTIAYIITPESTFFARFVDDPGSITAGYVYITLFVLMICAGYILGRRRRGDRSVMLASATEAAATARAGWLVATVGIAVALAVTGYLLYRRDTGVSLSNILSLDALHDLNRTKLSRIEGVEGFGNSFAAIKLLYAVPTAAMVATFAALLARKSTGVLLRATVLLAVTVFTVLVQGQRTGLLDIFIYAGCLYVLIGGRLTQRVVFRLAIAGAMIVALLVLMTTLRMTKGELGSTSFSLDQLVSQLFFSTYFLDINMSIILVDRAPPGGTFFGSSYFSWIVGLIPRDLWPDKPAIALGPYVKQVILNLQGTIGGVNPTGPGEAFLNFGWFGPVVGLFLGLAYRRAEEFLLAGNAALKRYGLFLYPLVLYPFVQATLQSTFGTVMVGLIAKTVIVLIFLRWFVYPVARRGWRPARPALVRTRAAP